jgi:hypothetical protein
MFASAVTEGATVFTDELTEQAERLTRDGSARGGSGSAGYPTLYTNAGQSSGAANAGEHGAIARIRE